MAIGGTTGWIVDDGSPAQGLAWAACGLGFRLSSTVADDELIRVAESIVEQCDG